MVARAYCSAMSATTDGAADDDLLRVWRARFESPVSGWNFADLNGEMAEEVPPWSYTAIARDHLRHASHALDMGTGGGEVLKDLAARNPVPLVGLNYKDEIADAQTWLDRLGDPYRVSVVDAEGQVGIDWGVYGVPETFLIDHEGVIRYKHVGPVNANDVNKKLLPLIEELQQLQPS